MYLLKDRRTGKYVADQKKRQGSSFTNNLKFAKTYPTAEAAEADRCPGSEYITTVEEEMR